MAKKPVGLLSFGILVLLAALSLAVWGAGLIEIGDAPALVLALFGVWIMASARIRSEEPKKHERSAFSTFSWGVLTSAVGTVWFLSNRQVLSGYLPSIFLFVIGVLVVIAALRYWKK